MRRIVLLVKPILLLTFLFVAQQCYSQPSASEEKEASLIISSISKEELCAGDELLVQVKWVGSSPIPPPYVTYIQLSDSGGNFSSFTNIGSVHKESTIVCVVPRWVEAGRNYKLRVHISPHASNTYSIYPKPLVISRLPPRYTIEGDSKSCVGMNQPFLIELEPGDVPKWAVTNGTIVDTLVDGVIVKWNEAGTGLLSVVAKSNSCGIAEKATLEVAVNTTNSCITPTEAATHKGFTLVVHHNKFNNSVELETNFPIKNISVLNCTGQVLQKISNENSISFEHIPAGFYLLRVEGNNGERIAKKYWR